MSDYQGLLQAIIDNPQDDIPRLIFADLLEDMGQTDRAEFIRIQVAQWQATDDSEGTYYCDKAWSLMMKKDLISWFDLSYLSRYEVAVRSESSMTLHGGDNILVMSIRRGFVDKVYIKESIWLSVGQRIAARQPIEEIKFLDKVSGGDIGNSFWQRGYHRPGKSINSCLDPNLYDKLSKGKTWIGESGMRRKYYNGGSKDALADLSSAALRWAKEKTNGLANTE